MQGAQEPGQFQARRSLVALDKGLHSQAEGLSPAHRLHFAEEGIQKGLQVEEEAAEEAREAAVGVQGVLGVDPVVLAAGGCSVTLTKEASALWVEGALSGTGKAESGVEPGAEFVVASAQRETGLNESMWEGVREEEKTLVEKKEALLLQVGRSPGM